MKERRTRDSLQRSRYHLLEEAAEYEENSLLSLRANGLRITMPRVQVIRALADAESAMSAYAIHEKIIEGHGKIDVVSVYRILQTLDEIGLVYHIGIVNGYYPCKRLHGRARITQVVLCAGCNSVIEVDAPEAALSALAKQAETMGYKLNSGKIEITASSCAKCKSKSTKK